MSDNMCRARNIKPALNSPPNIIFASTVAENNRRFMDATKNNFPGYALSSNTIDLDQLIREKGSLKTLGKLSGQMIHTQFPMVFLGSWEEFTPLLNHSIIVSTKDDLQTIHKSIECFLWESDEPVQKINQRFEQYWENIRNSIILVDNLDNQRAYFHFMRSISEKLNLELPKKLKPLKSTPEKIKQQLQKITERISLNR